MSNDKLCEALLMPPDMNRAQLCHCRLREVAAERDEARARSEWVLHNAGLLNEWAAKQWSPGVHPPLIEWLRQRIDAVLAGEKK